MSKVNKSEFILDLLPKVFYEHNEEVDIELLRKIFSSENQPAKKIRKLLAKTMGGKVPDSDAYIPLANKIALPSFRESWYENSSKTKGEYPSPLFINVDTLVQREFPNLGLSSKVLNTFFEYNPANKKRYPLLENINVLIDELEKVAITDSKMSALFAWSLMEGAQWHATSEKGEHSRNLNNLPSSIISALKRRELQELVDLLSPIKLEIKEIKNNVTENKPLKVESKLEMINKEEPEVSQHEYLVTEIARVVDERSVFLEKLSQKRSDLDKKYKNLDVMQQESFNQMVLALHSYREVAVEIEEYSKQPIVLACEVLNKSFPNILPLLGLNNLPNLVGNVSEWQLYCLNFGQVTAKVCDALAKLNQLSTKALSYVDISQDSFSSIESMLEWIEEILQRAKIIESGINSFNKLEELLRLNCFNLSWSPFTDNSLNKDIWSDIAQYLLLSGAHPSLASICIRCDFTNTCEPLLSWLESEVNKRNDDSIYRIINVLQHLTLGQIEYIYSKNSSLREVIAIAELSAYLNLDHLSGESLVIWNSSPLSEMVNRHNELSQFEQFIWLVNNCITGSSININYKYFRKLVRLAQSGPSTNEIYYTQLIVRLGEILKYYPSGGWTFASIWEQAYNQLFNPLLLLLNSQNFSPEYFCKEYIRIRDEFDINSHIESWKVDADIQKHLKKDSHYDKKIRIVIRSKFDDLDDWIDEFISFKNSAPVDQSYEVKELLKFLQNYLASPYEQYSPFASWLKFENQSKYSSTVIPMSVSRTVDAALNIPINQLFEISNFRSYFAQIHLGKSATYSSIFTDELINTLIQPSNKDLAKFLVNAGYLEIFEVLLASDEEEIPNELIKLVDNKVDFLVERQSDRIKAISEGIQLHGLNEAEFSPLQADISQLLEKRLWTKLENDLTFFEEVVTEAIESKIQNEKLKELQNEIEDLGGSVSSILQNEASFKAHLLKLQTDTNDRRKHLIPIRKFLKLKDICPEIYDEASTCLGYIQLAKMLPSEQDSDYLALVIDEPIEVLFSFLKSKKVLLPTFASKLIQLSNVVLVVIKNLLSSKEGTKKLIELFEITEKHWKSIDIDVDLDSLIGIINLHSQVANDFTEIRPIINIPRFESNNVIGSTEVEDANSQYNKNISDLDISRLFEFFKINTYGEPNSLVLSDDTLITEIKTSGWAKTLPIAGALLELHKQKNPNLNDKTEEYLTNVAVCELFSGTKVWDLSNLALVLKLINKHSKATTVKYLLPDKNRKGQIGECGARFFNLLVTLLDTNSNVESKSPPSFTIGLEGIVKNGRLAEYSQAIRKAFDFEDSSDKDNVVLKGFWNSLSGEQKQAELRASIMSILWISGAQKALSSCFQYLDFDKRKADVFANAASKYRENGELDAVQSFIELKESIQKKPFQLFVDEMLSRLRLLSEKPAKIYLPNELERSEGSSVLRGILEIDPRRSDSPDKITITLPPISAIKFGDGKYHTVLTGPFLEKQVVPVSFELVERNASSFPISARCEAESITGKKEVFEITLQIDIAGSAPFKRLTEFQIDEAFDGFPSKPMRHEDYVPRIENEKRIEHFLFQSRVIRSIWISSPRRSGKTTMLYRILDGYSHIAGRDTAVVYLSLDQVFISFEEFNSWIWQKLNRASQNSALRGIYKNFETIGSSLRFDDDVSTFLASIGDKLIAGNNQIQRVIFLFDEVDMLARMYLGGIHGKNVANGIMWQLRNLISERGNIGVVLAGSSAPKWIFIDDPSSALYNSISLVTLTPFSCVSSQAEEASRRIVEPLRIKGFHTLPKKTVEHLVNVCAGIPYYMKLLAGALYATANQSYLLESDVNIALQRLLNKSTGINPLDSITNPGQDELTTIANQDPSEKCLAEGVLASVAELYSPIGKHRLFKGMLWSDNSRLVRDYNLSKELILQGLEICVRQGILKITGDGAQEVSFSIPILGESIRHNVGAMWAKAHDQLELLSKYGSN